MTNPAKVLEKALRYHRSGSNVHGATREEQKVQEVLKKAEQLIEVCDNQARFLRRSLELYKNGSDHKHPMFAKVGIKNVLEDIKQALFVMSRASSH